MTAIHDDGGRQIRRLKLPFRHRDTDGIVVDPTAAAAQHDMRMLISLGAKYRRLAGLRDAKEVMRMPNRAQGVDRCRQRAVSAVLEAHWSRQSARHFTMSLRFGGAGADGRPGNQLRQIL